MQASAKAAAPKLFVQGTLGEVALLNPASQSLLLYSNRSGAFRSIEGVKAYDMCGRFSAAVFDDGRLDVISGAPSFSMPQESDYVTLSVNTRSVFAVRADGSVTVKGECAFDEQIAGWRSVEELSVGEYHLAARMSDGSVRFASSDFAIDALKESPDWSDITRIVSAADCTLGMTSRGTVRFAGSQKDPRGLASGWSDVVSVAVDDGLAVGLTSDGLVLLAGRQDICVDYGCFDAAFWSDVVTVTCGRACIMGINSHGELLLAGNVSFGSKLFEQWPTETVRRCISG